MESNGDGTFDLKWLPDGKNAGHGKVTVRVGQDGFTDQINIARKKARDDFLDDVWERWPALKVPEHKQHLQTELERIAMAESERAANPSSITEPATPDVEKLLAETPADIRTEAEAMLLDPNLAKRVIDDVAALGVAGERELIMTVYLVGTSRLLEKPLAAIVQGPSSSGKSYLLEKVASLFPTEAVIHATAMTPQALYYMRPGSLKHRFVVAGERSRIEDDESAEATRALREMLSGGKLAKLLPIKADHTGRMETVTVAQDGPIAFVESTTKAKIFDEDANRRVLIHTDERTQQTKRIITRLAASYSNPSSASDTERIILRHHALQRMLERKPVVIFYAERLAELFLSDRVQVRRAFPQLLSMIQAAALLHQRQRPNDPAGRVIATTDDYQLARHLLVKPMASVLGGRLSDPSRRFFERLAEWFNVGHVFTTRDAAKKEKASRRSVVDWLSELHDAGLIELKEPRRGPVPAKWERIAVSPDAPGCDCPDLPTLEAVFPGADFRLSDNGETAAGTIVRTATA
jgi:hypothetical protein